MFDGNQVCFYCGCSWGFKHPQEVGGDLSPMFRILQMLLALIQAMASVNDHMRMLMNDASPSNFVSDFILRRRPDSTLSLLRVLIWIDSHAKVLLYIYGNSSPRDLWISRNRQTW